MGGMELAIPSKGDVAGRARFDYGDSIKHATLRL
jgi:hypothetical protein